MDIVEARSGFFLEIFCFLCYNKVYRVFYPAFLQPFPLRDTQDQSDHSIENRTIEKDRENMKEIILSVKGLNLTVKGKHLLENINFSLDKGDYLAISGICGAGKSVLMKSLLGLITSGLSGEILYHNIKKDEVTYIPQNTLDLREEFLGTAKEVVAVGLLSRLKGGCMTEEHWQKVDELLSVLHLSDVKDKKINKLSQWQQFKVKIARHLICDPKLLFIDNPPSTSNTKLKTELYKILKNLCNERNITIVHITSEVKGISSFADKLLFLNKGDNSFYFGDTKHYMPVKNPEKEC